jgi:hypothetical protein
MLPNCGTRRRRGEANPSAWLGWALAASLILWAVWVVLCSGEGVWVDIPRTQWGVRAYSVRSEPSDEGAMRSDPPPAGLHRQLHRLIGFYLQEAYSLRIGDCVYEITHDVP